MDDLVLSCPPYGNASVHEFSAHDDTCLIGAGCKGLGLVSRQSNPDFGTAVSTIPYPTLTDLDGHDAAAPSSKSPNAGDTFLEAITGKLQSRIQSPGDGNPGTSAHEVVSMITDHAAPGLPPQDDKHIEEEYHLSDAEIEPEVAHSAFILQGIMTSAKEASANIVAFHDQPTLYEHDMSEHNYDFDFPQEAGPDCPDPGSHATFAHLYQTQAQTYDSQHQVNQQDNLMQVDPFDIFALGPHPYCHAPALPGASGQNSMVHFQGHAHSNGNFPGECGLPFQTPLQASLHIQQHAQHGQLVQLMDQGLHYSENMQLQHPNQPVLDFPGMETESTFSTSNNNFAQQPVTSGNQGGLFAFGHENLPSPKNENLGRLASPRRASFHPSASDANQDVLNSPAESCASNDGQMQDTGSSVCLWGQGASKCGMVFENAEELEMHVQTQHVENMEKADDGYVCAWADCGRRHKPFAQKSKVKRHMLTHTQYKPFKCDHCAQSFSAKQALSQHVLIHKNAKPLKCDICGKAFRQQSALTMHIRTHTHLKPLKCDVCGALFGESSNLSKHRRTHDAIGRHACPEPLCNKRFNRLDQCRRHLETVHKRRPEEVKQLVGPMTYHRGSSARCSQSSSSSVAGSNKASHVPSKKASKSVHATPVDFVQQGGTTKHVSRAENPDNMAAPMRSPSILQYAQISTENAPLLYSSQDRTEFATMPLQQQSYAAGGAILNETAYNFNQPLQNYAESAW
ncbi:zinc finger protein 664 [Diaporthe helianthi]|uniref:Zinc finger protein 664 n=1 Tax=Diaporthe helianthi TaxID=158607 RepID=A0A2P5HSF0_DIAHE|nr:zinc finger protein 664 [Diaporthe helianthi]